jgi:hypothetical protein
VKTYAYTPGPWKAIAEGALFDGCRLADELEEAVVS